MNDELTQEPIPQTEHQDDKVWLKTRYANLYLYVPSGVYHVKASVGGRLVRQSLKTRSCEIAKNKMDQLLAAERGRIVLNPDCKWTFADMVQEYEQRLDTKVKTGEMKPRAKDYRIETIKQIRATWPKVDAATPKMFTEQSLLDWAARLREKYSETRYNGAIQTMRGILQVAVDNGVLLTNPAITKKRNSSRGIPAATVPLTPPNLPGAEKFHALLKYLESDPRRKRSERMVKLMTYTGMRISAVRKLRPDCISLERNEIGVPPVKYQAEMIKIPMIPEMRKLAEELLEDYPGAGPLIPIKSPRRALENACKAVGIPKLTSHDFRHMFTTRAIECGIDVKTIATWLGHQDGGRLILRIYGHTRIEHAQQMAAKLWFTTGLDPTGSLSLPAVASAPVNTHAVVPNYGTIQVTYATAGGPVQQQVNHGFNYTVTNTETSPHNHTQSNANPEANAHTAPDREPSKPPASHPPCAQGIENETASDNAGKTGTGE